MRACRTHVGWARGHSEVHTRTTREKMGWDRAWPAKKMLQGIDGVRRTNIICGGRGAGIGETLRRRWGEATIF